MLAIRFTLTHSLNSGSLSPREAADWPINRAKIVKTRKVRKCHFPAVRCIMSYPYGNQIGDGRAGRIAFRFKAEENGTWEQRVLASVYN